LLHWLDNLDTGSPLTVVTKNHALFTKLVSEKFFSPELGKKEFAILAELGPSKLTSLNERGTREIIHPLFPLVMNFGTAIPP
jgi:hypothetical protein